MCEICSQKENPQESHKSISDDDNEEEKLQDDPPHGLTPQLAMERINYMFQKQNALKKNAKAHLWEEIRKKEAIKVRWEEDGSERSIGLIQSTDCCVFGENVNGVPHGYGYKTYKKGSIYQGYF